MDSLIAIDRSVLTRAAAGAAATDAIPAGQR